MSPVIAKTSTPETKPASPKHLWWKKRLANWPEKEKNCFQRSAKRLALSVSNTLYRIASDFDNWRIWTIANKLPLKPCNRTFNRYGRHLLRNRAPRGVATTLKRIRAACHMIYDQHDWRWIDPICSELWAQGPKRKRHPKTDKPSSDRRRSLPFDEWPDELRNKWLAATAQPSGSRLERIRRQRSLRPGAPAAAARDQDRKHRRPGARNRSGRNRRREDLGYGTPGLQGKHPYQWSSATRKRNIRAYGYLLFFQRQRGLGPELTEACFDKWVTAMDDNGLSPRTSAGWVEGVYAVAGKVMWPRRDWTWLAHDLADLRADVKPARDKAQKFVELRLAWSAALDLMDRAEQRSHYIYSASTYEAGLMLALLLFLPLRIKNLAELTVGEHVILDAHDNPVLIRVRTKDPKRPLRTFNFPPDLLPYWHRYWSWYRTFLRGAENNMAVWPSPNGGHLTINSARVRLMRGTKESLLGKSLNPHLVRDIVATALSEIGRPEAARVLLGQRDLASLQPYIRLVNSRIAARRLRQILDRYRDAFPPPVTHKRSARR